MQKSSYKKRRKKVMKIITDFKQFRLNSFFSSFLKAKVECASVNEILVLIPYSLHCSWVCCVFKHFCQVFTAYIQQC